MLLVRFGVDAGTSAKDFAGCAVGGAFSPRANCAGLAGLSLVAGLAVVGGAAVLGIALGVDTLTVAKQVRGSAALVAARIRLLVFGESLTGAFGAGRVVAGAAFG